MSAQDDAVAAAQSGISASLQALYQAGVASVQQSTGEGFSQADVDAAVKKASDALNAQIADLELEDEQEKALNAKILAELQGLVSELQPAPAPAPTPAQDPAVQPQPSPAAGS